MDQISKVKSEFRLNQWTKRIQECQSSNQTVGIWCDQNGVNIKTYYYWLRKIRAKACESMVVPQRLSNEKPVEFTKLQVQTPLHDTQTAVIIHLPSATIEIKDGVSQQTIEGVLQALKNIC